MYVNVFFIFSVMSVSLAYQLRVCQPPPEVANADTLMEDNDFEIGKCLFPPNCLLYCAACPHTSNYVLIHSRADMSPTIQICFSIISDTATEG